MKKDDDTPLKGIFLNKNGKYQKGGRKSEEKKHKSSRENNSVKFSSTDSVKTVDQRAINSQRKLLEKFIPENLSDTQDGLMYYRVSTNGSACLCTRFSVFLCFFYKVIFF